MFSIQTETSKSDTIVFVTCIIVLLLVLSLWPGASLATLKMTSICRGVSHLVIPSRSFTEMGFSVRRRRWPIYLFAHIPRPILILSIRIDRMNHLPSHRDGTRTIVLQIDPSMNYSLPNRQLCKELESVTKTLDLSLSLCAHQLYLVNRTSINLQRP